MHLRPFRTDPDDSERFRVGENREKEKSGQVSYLSLLDWKDTWIASKRFPFTPSTSDVYALSAALDEILEEGLANVLQRHASVAKYCREKVKD